MHVPLIAPSHIAALTDPATWLDNPFLRREAARDARRRHPARSIAWTLGALAAVAAGGGIGLTVLLGRGYGVPWFAGGAAGTALCALLCGVHAWFITAAARKHTALMFHQEAWRNTLPGLLLLPVPPFQTLVQASAYPWLAAMRIALVGLPFYAACVALGGVSWVDVLMLYVVFALVSFSVPAWGRPALAEDITVPPVPGASPGAAFGVPSPEQRAAQQAQSQAGLAPMLGALPVFVIFIVVLAASQGSVGRVYSAALAYAPDAVLQLVPSAVLSWPLLLARALITPFDWFGLPLPPLPFVLLSAAASRYLAAARTAEFLQVGAWRDLAGQPTYRPRRLLAARLGFAQLVVATGYLWKWAITNGGLGALTHPALGLPARPLAGLALIVLVVTFWRVTTRAGMVAGWLRPPAAPKRDDEEATEPTVARRARAVTAAAFLAAPLASGVGLYVLCCALARTWPFAPAVCRVALEMLAVMLGGAALNFAVWRVRPGLAPLGLLLLPLVVAGPPSMRPLAVLSPSAAVLTLLDPMRVGEIGAMLPMPTPLVQTVRGLPPWWAWPAACGSLAGALLLLYAAGRAARRAGRPSPATAQPATVLDPALYGAEVFQDDAAARISRKDRPDTPAARRLVGLVQRVLGDNAVAVKELRARSRWRLGPREQRATAIIWGVATLAAIGLPPAVAQYTGAFGSVLFPSGDLSTPLAQSGTGVLAFGYMILAMGGLGAALSVLALAFAPEREKSTLGFLLTTPMRSSAILAGKAVGILLPALIWVAEGAAWSFVVSLVIGPAVGLRETLSVWAGVWLTVGLALVAVACACLAVASLFPRRLNPGCGMGVMWLLIQVPFQALNVLGRGRIGRGRRRRRRSLVRALLRLSPQTAWLVLLAACLAAAVACILLALWGVNRMRRGDIAFESSKREN